jgi:hypothetical protein
MMDSITVTWPMIVVTGGVVIGAMIAVWFLAVHYERRGYSFMPGEGDGEARDNMMWRNGYDAAIRDHEGHIRVLDEADQYIGELRGDDFTDGRPLPGPDAALAGRLPTAGQAALLDVRLESQTFLAALDGWSDRVLAGIWGDGPALTEGASL